MQCSRCQADNREGRRFCAECGVSLALTCPSCGFSNEPGEKFCGGCGQPLQVAAAPAPAPKFASPDSYTPKHLAEKILTSKSALEGDRLYVVAEVRDPAVDPKVLSQLVREIVQRVQARCGHRPARVLLAKPQTLPKTSSGKIQRFRLAQLIARNELPDRIVHRSAH